MTLQENILLKQSSFEQFCSQFDWYDFKILGSFLTRLDYPFDTTTQSLHSLYQLFNRKGIARTLIDGKEEEQAQIQALSEALKEWLKREV